MKFASSSLGIIVTAAIMLGGCVDTSCEPHPAPVVHMWQWYSGPFDLEAVAAEVREDGWFFSQTASPEVYRGWRVADGAAYNLAVLSEPDSSAARLEANQSARYEAEAIRVLMPVIAELNETFDKHFGEPRVARYEAGFPCGG